MQRTEAIQIIAEDMLGKLTPDEAVKAIHATGRPCCTR